jgi:hypothetical protein
MARRNTLDETANDNQDGATHAYFAFACFAVAWVVAIGNGETRSESWGRFHLQNKNARKTRLAP